MADIPADVLIIGAGASGGVAALSLARAGLRVVALEQGQWPDRAGYPGDRPEFELVAAKQWSSSPSLRGADADYPVDLRASDMGVVNFNGVGGGTVLYNAQWPRMRPDDFRVRSVDGVAADWPLTYAELQPFYEATDRQFGVSGLAGNPMYPDGADFPLPPLPIGELATRVARAHARLGWHWWPATNAIASAGIDGRNPCVQRGTCGSGCNEGAKASTDLTHWPKVVELGGEVITGARVRRITVDEAGLATGAEWIDREGVVHHAAADIVIVACNGIGTPRLLLNSADGGLANSSGLVGRNLMLHPLLSVSGIFDHAAADGWRAHNGGLIHSQQFSASDPARGFIRGALWELGTAGGPLRHVYAPDGVGVWGAEHHRHLRRRLGRTASWVVIAEDLPDPHNRVALSAGVTDSDGIPAAELHYTISENTKALFDFHGARARESLLEAGALEVEIAGFPANGHFMGTARMGDDPATSVVDRWCRSHDIANLLIVDGSVFVTAGSANPTSTIAALALRAAEHLVTERERIPRPKHRTQQAFAGQPQAGDDDGEPALKPEHGPGVATAADHSLADGGSVASLESGASGADAAGHSLADGGPVTSLENGAADAASHMLADGDPVFGLGRGVSGVAADHLSAGGESDSGWGRGVSGVVAADHMSADGDLAPGPDSAALAADHPHAGPVTPDHPIEARMAVFDDELRERFGAIADRLIPAADGMPAASAVGVHRALLDRVLIARPDLIEAVAEAALADPGDGPPEAIAGVLRYAAAGAYYLSPEVLTRLRFRVDDPTAVVADTYPAYVDEGLLDHLLTP